MLAIPDKSVVYELTTSKSMSDCSETKFDSLFDETITTIKEREQTMIDSIRKYSIELQKQIELDRKSEKKKFLNLKRQTDQY
jgi:hypothetical protein